jgi:hypothetical protein
MGISLTTGQQDFFNTYKNMDKSANTAALDLAYANFLKVLKEVDGTTNRALIYLNRYLNPAWFDGSDYDATKLSALFTVLQDYITTTNQDTRNAKHLEVVAYLKNTTVSGLFLQNPPRTKTIFSANEYTDGGDITATYVSVARASASIGSNSFEDTMM